MSTNWTKDDYERYLQRKNSPKRSNVQLQKLENADNPLLRDSTTKAKDDHEAGVSKENGVVEKGYRIDVVFLVSDKRRRDPTGMLETVADILIGAIGRFNQGDARRILGDTKSSQG